MQLFLDLILHLDVQLAQLLAAYGSWVYAILFLVIFAETGLVILPFLPGDSLLFIVGAFAAKGDLQPALVLGLLWSAAVLGDNCNYFIGRFFGHRLFNNPNSRLFRQDRLQETHAFYERHGGKTLIVARFVPIIRTFAPFVAGLGEMLYLRFLAFSVCGGLLWVGSLLLAGYVFGNLPWVKHFLTPIIFGIIFVSLLPVIVHSWQSWRKGRKLATGLG